MLTTSIFIPGMIATLATIAYASVRLPLSVPDHTAPQVASHPLRKVDHPIDAITWLDGWPHEVPDRPMSPLEAHQTMQRHRSCGTKGCARKAAAFDVLVGTGAIRPRRIR